MKNNLAAIAALSFASAALAQEEDAAATDADAATASPASPAPAAPARGDDPAYLTDERRGKFEGFYVRAGFGVVGVADSDYALEGVEREIEFDPGYGGSAAVGYDFGSLFRPGSPKDSFTINLRSEIELSYERVDSDDEGGAGAARLEKLWSRGAALNTYVDFDTPTRWTFYAGFGVGAAQLETEGVGFDDSDTSGFVQLMGGAMFDVTSRASLYAGLRSRGYADVDAEEAELQDLASGSLEVGLMFSF